VRKLLSRFTGRRILVYGDYVLDEFLFGQIDRISREAPVFIVLHQNSDFRPGCAANTVANLAALGATVFPCGIIGRDDYGRHLQEILRSHGVDTAPMVVDGSIHTALKTRVIAGGAHSIKQQIVRIDRLNDSRAGDAANQSVRAALQDLLPDCDAVLISDYGIGALDLATAQWLLRSARALGKPVLVDSRYRLPEYAGATAATPNQPELEGCVGRAVTSPETMHAAGEELRRRLELESLVVTRGGEGMSLFRDDRPPLDIPAFGDEEVVDVTGAGDTVIAAFTLGVAAGGDHADAARLANIAGGLSVCKRGTCTVSADELAAALDRARS
jgi:rfaE bifunctional protein kinase chain/domain